MAVGSGNRPMRVLCLIPSMGPGGAERVMAYLISHLANGHTVSLMVWEGVEVPSFYPLPDLIRVVKVGLLGGRNLPDRLCRLFLRFRSVRREAREFRPDVVVSFMDTMNMTAIISLLGTGLAVVVSERVDPAKHRIGLGKALLRRWVYPLASCCVVQTERIKSYFSRFPRPVVLVMPNPVLIPDERAVPGACGPSGRLRIIGVGRLEPQKGFDLLIDAFSRLARSHAEWDLFIYGEGSMRAELEGKAESAGLRDRVFLPGLCKQIPEELSRSHIMAFPSRYEGFPNALAEGLATGLPAVGFRGVSGVEELIAHNETGLLIDSAGSVPGLAKALQLLMENPHLRASLGAEARCRMERYRPDIICRNWENLLLSVAGVSDPETGGQREKSR